MGWNPLIAIQIEYSLLERTVEYDFMAMATALGLGVTPWSPQAGGALTGKYGRDGSVLGGSVRGKAVGKRLGEREFAIIDRLRAIAERIGHTPGQVALAWVCNRPAVTAPIIGARTLKQFEENMNAPDIVLDAEDMRSLDDVSRPSAFFPHDALKRVWGTSHGGLTLNGRSYATSPGSPRGANSLG
jgi:aryl-alcohol dehydrogenase-like predicted oxidoreductase